MKGKLLLLLGVVALLALPAASMAAVVGSAHDLPLFYTYTGTDAKMGTCSFCHIPHKASSGGEKLFPSTYAAGLPAAWSSDTLSNFCWYCHGAAAGTISAREVNPFNGANHKRNTTLLTQAGGVTGH